MFTFSYVRLKKYMHRYSTEVTFKKVLKIGKMCPVRDICLTVAGLSCRI